MATGQSLEMPVPSYRLLPLANLTYIEQAQREGRDSVVFRNGDDEFYVLIHPPHIQKGLGAC